MRRDAKSPLDAVPLICRQRREVLEVDDPRAQAILLFGVWNEPTYFSDLWTFDGTCQQVPAVSANDAGR